MRTIVRIGGLVGGIAFLVLYATQSAVALIVAFGVVLAGACGGLVCAKWLEREWYGRQLHAGLRAGALSAGVAAVGALLSLLFLGPRDIGQLAARSHLAALDLAPVVRSLSFLGWAGVDALTLVIATLAGVGLGALVCQTFAWSKSARAVRVIAQARLAAQALNRDEVYRATGAPSTYGPAVHASHLLAQLGVSGPGAAPTTGGLTGTTPALGIIPPPTFSPASVPGLVAPQHMTAAPVSAPSTADTHAQVARNVGEADAASAYEATEASLTEPALPAAPNSKARRSSSAARRAEAELTDAMRDALAAWANDNSAEARTPAPVVERAKPSRTPAPSAYLNSAPPAKKGRKKSDTQDWLC